MLSAGILYYHRVHKEHGRKSKARDQNSPMKSYLTLLIGLLLTSLATLHAAPSERTGKPNVIIILADDQGYGDIGAHGHPFLKTPNMDKLHAESVRFTDFHVAPMCSPTRGQLMTGVDAMKNGSTAVCQGRSMVREEIPMLSNYFADAGYATGLFGKWHLGDSYPYRPQDRGFQEVVSFRAWGLPSLASNWKNNEVNPQNKGNSYDNPVLEHNGVDTPYTGFCSDIWFNEAMNYMAECKKIGKPFFIYLPDNLAHSPDLVPEQYSKPYAEMGTVKGIDGKDVKVPAKYYGQIAKIDENLGRLNEFLEKTGLKDNTILVYSSDNGARSVEATEIYDAGMSGHKTELIEGGHRVPCFIRWPKSDIKPCRDVSELTTVQDIAPTLLDLCGIKPTNLYPMDGVTLSPLLRGEPWQHENRNIAIQYTADGGPWKSAAVMSGKWRLIGGKNLFNIADDPTQKKNVAQENPEVFNRLNNFYNDWHKQASVEFQKPRYIHLGNTQAPEVILYANDWQGGYCDNAPNLINGKAKGAWDIAIDTTGTYQVELSRWPFESGKMLVEGDASHSTSSKGALPVAKAQLIIGDTNQTIDTAPDDKIARFTLPLQTGKTTLTANLLDKEGKTICGAMYVKATLVK